MQSFSLFTCSIRFCSPCPVWGVIGKNLLFAILLLLLSQGSLSAQCGTSSADMRTPASEETFEAPGPFAVRLYLYILRTSDGGGGLSAGEVQDALAQIREDFEQANIFFSVACIENIASTYLYYSPNQIFVSSYGHADGVNLFLTTQADVVLGRGEIGGNRAWVLYNADLRHNVSHELGHILSLYHTFRGSNCTEPNVGGDPFGDPDMTGDLISDTPPDSGIYPFPGTGCENLGTVTCSGNQTFTNPGENVLYNIMSYAEQSCRTLFTDRQKEVMRAHIATYKMNMVINAGWVNADYTLTGTDLYYDTDIVVSAPSTLTVSFCTLHIAKGHRIIVEPGARLKLDNAMLTDWPAGGCAGQSGHLWTGIILQSNSTTTTAAQVTMNGGTIENAQVAVFFDNSVQNSSIVQPVVKALGTKFHNNVTAVSFHSVVSPTIGRENTFTRCTFLLDQDFQGTEFYEMVRLNYILNTTFSGCTFTNLIQANQSNLVTTYGINAYNSRVNVTRYALSFPSTFNGFFYGINASKSSVPLATLTVKYTQFDNTLYGVYATAMNNNYLTDNTFNVGSNYFGLLPQYGLYMNTGTGFIIRNNHAYRAAGALSEATRGMTIINTGSENNSIVLNDFHNLRKSIEALGRNRHPVTATIGLQLLCNTNENPINDGFNFEVNSYTSTVLGTTTTTPGTINTNQGSINSAAGNTFPISAFPNFRNVGPDVVNYYYLIGAATQYPNSSSIGITRIGTNATPVCYPAILQDLPSIKDKYLQLDTDYNGKLDIYTGKIDQGKTQDLLTTVQNATSSEATNVYNKLTAVSPYLSASVLETAFNRSDIFSAQQRSNLLAANPDVLKSGDFMKLVQTSAQPLGTTDMQAVEQARYTSTVRTGEEAELSNVGAQRADVINQGLTLLLADSVTDYTALRTWWGYRHSFEAGLDIADSYLAQHNPTAWTQSVSALSASPLTSEQSTDLTNYTNFRQLVLDAASNDRSEEKLNPTEVTTVNNIALASDRYVSRLAKNLLERFYGYHFNESVAAAPEDRSQPDNSGQTTSLNDAGETILRVYPNPAGQELTFEWLAAQPETGASLTISDAYGQYTRTFRWQDRLLRVQPPAERMQPGLYYYTLKTKGGVLQSGKFIVR